MDLLILRHGKAGERVMGVPDDERTLTTKGTRDIRGVARWMSRTGSVPDLIVSSPVPRARETAEIVGERIAFPGEIAFWEELRPGSSVGDLLPRLGDLDGASLPLLVGHEPLLSSLVPALIGAGEGARILIGKGGMARIGNLSQNPEGGGELQWLLTVRQMRDMG